VRRLGRDRDASGRELDAVLFDGIEKRGQIGGPIATEDLLGSRIAQLRKVSAVVVGEDQLGSVDSGAARISPAPAAASGSCIRCPPRQPTYAPSRCSIRLFPRRT